MELRSKLPASGLQFLAAAGSTAGQRRLRLPIGEEAFSGACRKHTEIQFYMHCFRRNGHTATHHTTHHHQATHAWVTKLTRIFMFLKVKTDFQFHCPRSLSPSCVPLSYPPFVGTQQWNTEPKRFYWVVHTAGGTVGHECIPCSPVNIFCALAARCCTILKIP